MTDLRKLLIEARAWIVANEKHESVCPTRVMGTWGRCRCGFVSIIGRIDAALAEKVEPVADWFLFVAYGEGQVDTRFCFSRDDVRKAYAECFTGSDDEAHKEEIDGFMESFDDVDMNWSCEGRVYSEQLYCAHVEIFKMSPKDFPKYAAPADQWRRVEDWRPIETAPKDGERVLVCCANGFQAVAYWSTSVWVSTGGAWVFEECRSDTVELEPTHWMPLPALPEGE